MEGVIAVEEGPDTPIGGVPSELDTFAEQDTGDLAVANAEAHLDKMIRLLKASGVEFPGNKNLRSSAGWTRPPGRRWSTPKASG